MALTGRSRRAFHAEVPGEGAEIVLDPEESHHLARVLRLHAGDPVSVFDGRGGEWDGRLVEASARASRLSVGAKRGDLVEPPLFVALLQGACRPERIEWVLQKGTEVGASAFAIVPFERSEGGEPGPAKRERWRRILLEACKQSGRRVIPALAVLDAVPALLPGEAGIVLDTGADVPPIGALLARPAPGRVRIAVGPEGGFERGEIEALVRSGSERAGLGPRVLRTETAGPVAAAIVLHAWGDLGRA